MHTWCCALGWNGTSKLQVLGACDSHFCDSLWYMDESIIGSAVELILLKSAWEFGPLVKISKVLALSGLRAIFCAPERSPLCGCAFGSLVLTLTLKQGDREDEILYKDKYYFSIFWSCEKREHIWQKRLDWWSWGRYKNCVCMLP